MDIQQAHQPPFQKIAAHRRRKKEANFLAPATHTARTPMPVCMPLAGGLKGE
jgi:hypothetical protein